ncbi:MAG: TetR/AcrR family transcriptional regulator [Caulobacteraceae bacterium]|nr:TetR/AcrR family transcriptional regulator [Caulobacteraceae bacterium]
MLIVAQGVETIEGVAGSARARRSAAVTRALVIGAARALFEERGYAGTTTRDIAQRAGTSEVALFRIFKSKAKLFESAVFEPFDRFIRAYAEEYGRTTDHVATRDADTRVFVEGLYKIMVDNRRLMLALITTGAYEDGVTAGLAGMRSLKEYFVIAEGVVRELVGTEAADVGMGVRFAFGLIAATALFEDWLLPGGRARPTTSRLMEQIGQFINKGFNGMGEPPGR